MAKIPTQKEISADFPTDSSQNRTDLTNNLQLTSSALNSISQKDLRVLFSQANNQLQLVLSDPTLDQFGRAMAMVTMSDTGLPLAIGSMGSEEKVISQTLDSTEQSTTSFETHAKSISAPSSSDVMQSANELSSTNLMSQIPGSNNFDPSNPATSTAIMSDSGVPEDLSAFVSEDKASRQAFEALNFVNNSSNLSKDMTNLSQLSAGIQPDAKILQNNQPTKASGTDITDGFDLSKKVPTTDVRTFSSTSPELLFRQLNNEIERSLTSITDISGLNMPDENTVADHQTIAPPNFHPCQNMNEPIGIDADSLEPQSPNSSKAGYYFINQELSSDQVTKDLSQPPLFNVENIRKDFPILQRKVNGKQLIWFDNGATSQKPKQVIEAEADVYRHYNSNVHRSGHTLGMEASQAYDSARSKVQQFIGASDPEEIIFLRGTTEAINLVSNSFGRSVLEDGDEILITEYEHHANIVPWQLITQATGANLKVIPFDDMGDLDLQKYSELLSERTKIVSISQVSNVLGTVSPLEVMIKMAKAVGATVIIDGAQSIAHIPVNVVNLGCDFYAFSGHKMFAPGGIGILYGRKELLDQMPPWQGGGNMIDTVTFDKTTYNDVPNKFEAGTPNLAGAVGLAKAIDYLSQIDHSASTAHENELLRVATQHIESFKDIKILGNSASKVSLVSFVVKDKNADAVAMELDKFGIAVRSGHMCAQPTLRHFGYDRAVRASFAIYNTLDEVKNLFKSLKKLGIR
jgi:SufS family cysteine desulfurase